MKLIYLFERRLPYEYDHIDFGYDDVMKYGWDIEVWCLLGLTNNVDVNAMPDGIKLDTGNYVNYVNSFKEFDDNLNSLNSDEVFFICYPYHAYDKNSYLIRKKLHEYNLNFANIAQSPGFDDNILRELPFGVTQAVKCAFRRYILGIGYYFVMWLKSMFSDEFSKKNFTDRWYCLIGPIKYPSCFNVYTTEIMYYFSPQLFSKWLERNFLIHTNSYTEYLRAKEAPCNSNNEYIVFIDQGLIGRDDVFLVMGAEAPIKDAEKYINDLSALFSRLEKDFGCEVVIAAHPKSNYQNGTFGKRKIIYGQTPELIKHAKLIIHQFSTAFFLAVLFKKDFLNIYTKEMWQTPRGNFKRCYRGFEVINCNLLDISDEKAVADYENYILHYDEEEYKKFENVAIIDNNSCYREKHFYTYVCEIIDEWKKKSSI